MIHCAALAWWATIEECVLCNGNLCIAIYACFVINGTKQMSFSLLFSVSLWAAFRGLRVSEQFATVLACKF